MTNMARRRALTRAELAALAVSLAELLGDSDAALSPLRRARFEGALTAVELALGRAPSLVGEERAAEIAELL